MMTKATLESIGIQGQCQNDYQESVSRDVIILVDGSDSFNSQIQVGDENIDDDGFQATLNCLNQYLLPALAMYTDILIVHNSYYKLS